MSKRSTHALKHHWEANIPHVDCVRGVGIPRGQCMSFNTKERQKYPMRWPSQGCGWSRRSTHALQHYMYTIYNLSLHPSPSYNKQASKQASNKQALLLSILAITPSQCYGLYSTLAILEPRWCPCQIQVLSQRLNTGAPGQWRQVGRCPPKTAHFVPQNSLFFLAQNGPKSCQIGRMTGNSCYNARAP